MLWRFAKKQKNQIKSSTLYIFVAQELLIHWYQMQANSTLSQTTITSVSIQEMEQHYDLHFLITLYNKTVCLKISQLLSDILIYLSQDVSSDIEKLISFSEEIESSINERKIALVVKFVLRISFLNLLKLTEISAWLTLFKTRGIV